MSNKNTSSSAPAIGGLTDTAVIEHLKACQSRVVAHAEERFSAFLKELHGQLLHQAEEATTNQQQAELYVLERELRAKSDELARYFCGYLGEGFVKFKKNELQTSTGEEKFQGDMLSLVDNEDLEETIAISSITHRAENYYVEALWGLNQRFAVLNNGQKVDERANPISPVQYCESLRKALKLIEFDTKAKILAYKAFDGLVIAQLSDAFSSVNGYLAEQGILANLRYNPAGAGADGGVVAPQDSAGFDSWAGDSTQYSAPQAAGGGASNAGFMASPDPTQPTEQYQGSLLSAIKVLQGHLSGSPAPADGGIAAGGVSGGGMQGGAAPAGVGGAGVAPTGAGAVPVGQLGQMMGGAPVLGAGPAGRQVTVYSNQQMVGALQNLQAQALLGESGLGEASPDGLVAQSYAQVSSQLTTQLQEEAEDGAVDPSDMHTIDLVGMLFEYMLSDDNLPDSVKALLSYLHTPFLKIAFIDKSFFEQTEHPARLLLNSMAEAGVKWVSNDGSSQYDIYEKVKGCVSRVLEEFENDVRLFAELLLEFSSYTKKIARRQELMERRAMEKVQGEEKLREVKIRVNEEVRSRTDGRELPSAVLLMLLQPWSDYLAFILLRYGEQSDSWQRAIQVIDDVLWSIEPKELNADKTRQLELHDQLLNGLETGFETIGYDQAKGKKLLEALFSLQRMALQSKQVEPAPAPMRDKLESMAAEKAGQSNAEEDQPNDDEARMVENLKMIEFGTWFEFEGGKRLKVAWYNSKTLHYMLVDQMGKKVAMRSGLELARAMLADKAKVIAGSSKPFFERALENIFQSLNAKAESLKPEPNDE